MNKDLYIQIYNLEQKARELAVKNYKLIKQICDLSDNVIDKYINKQIEDKKEYLLEIERIKELITSISKLDKESYSYYTIILDEIKTKLQ